MLKALSSTCDGKADGSVQLWPLSTPNMLIFTQPPEEKEAGLLIRSLNRYIHFVREVKSLVKISGLFFFLVINFFRALHKEKDIYP